VQYQMSRFTGSDPTIRIPAIGLSLRVRVQPSVNDGKFCFIETTNQPGFGPPLHRHPETEVFRILEGRYLFEVDGQRFYADEGDVVSVPGGSAHAFVNLSAAPARQYILIAPAMDAARFFTGLGEKLANGPPSTEALNEFGMAWGVEFLGPPISAPKGN